MEEVIGVVGGGTMGLGIAQLAAQHGHRVRLFESQKELRDTLNEQKTIAFEKAVYKEKMAVTEAEASASRILIANDISELGDCEIIFEAIVEDSEAKKSLFTTLSEEVAPEAILCTNTSSLSVEELSSGTRKRVLFLGAHFFNPPLLMKLVEIVPTKHTDRAVLQKVTTLLSHFGKITVLSKDSPGFIVNRIARPFYGEALAILEEGELNPAEIDYAMKSIGKFRMGPCELMDFIGHDVNYKANLGVYQTLGNDPRYAPSKLQKSLVDSGKLGKKTGEGFFVYPEGPPSISKFSPATGKQICDRIISMLVNEAVDAVEQEIASPSDIELAMTKGVNYPKGLLAWGEEIGFESILSTVNQLKNKTGNARYRPSALLTRIVKEQKTPWTL